MSLCFKRTLQCKAAALTFPGCPAGVFPTNVCSFWTGFGFLLPFEDTAQSSTLQHGAHLHGAAAAERYQLQGGITDDLMPVPSIGRGWEAWDHRGLGPPRDPPSPAGTAEARSLQENGEAPNSQPHTNLSMRAVLCLLSSPPLLNFRERFEAQHSRLQEDQS